MITKKYYLLLMGLLACSPNLDEVAFFRNAAGLYTLTETGALFLIREVKISVISTNENIIELRGDGSLSLVLSETNSLPIAQFIELKREDQGIFQLAGMDQFVAMGLDESLWISTTNAEPNLDFVLFEHLVPIARRQL